MSRINNYTGTSTLESMSLANYYNKWSYDQFSKYLNGEILEIGCGIGSFTSSLLNKGNVIAIDIDQNLIKQARQQNNQAKIGYGDIEKEEYFFGKKQFDTVVCINVLEHIKNDETALNNIFKLLKKDGNLILLVPIHQFLYGEIDKNIGHFRRYDPAGLVDKIKRLGLNIILAKKLNLLGAVGWFFAGRIFKDKHIEPGKIQIFNILAPLFLFLEKFIEPPLGTSVLIIAKK